MADLAEEERHAGAGAPARDRADGERVQVDRWLVRELIATIAETFTCQARNSASNLPFGRERAILVPKTGAPYLPDLDDRRRNPTLAEQGVRIFEDSPVVKLTRDGNWSAEIPRGGERPRTSWR